MITLPELLEDQRYRKFFCAVPHQGPQDLNWRIYVQRQAGGNWAKKDYAKYSDAFRRLAKEIKGGSFHDGTIQSRGIAYGPPERIVRVTKNGHPVMVKTAKGPQQKTAIVIWKPRLSGDEEEHLWCTYCRRPTVFRWFTTHHTLRGSTVGASVDPTDRRCTICGVRESFLRTTVKSANRPGYALTPISQRRRRK